MDGRKRIQKKRTKTIRASVDPFYITKLKYPAYNIHGRHLQVLTECTHWRCQLWGTGARAPLDLQQFIFFQCTLTCTKSGSDYMSTVASCKKTVNFFKCPSWHQILPTPLNARLLLADWVEPHVGSKTSLQSNLAKGRIAVLSPPRRRMQSSDLDRPSNKWFFGPT